MFVFPFSYIFIFLFKGYHIFHLIPVCMILSIRELCFFCESNSVFLLSNIFCIQRISNFPTSPCLHDPIHQRGDCPATPLFHCIHNDGSSDDDDDDGQTTVWQKEISDCFSKAKSHHFNFHLNSSHEMVHCLHIFRLG